MVAFVTSCCYGAEGMERHAQKGTASHAQTVSQTPPAWLGLTLGIPSPNVYTM